MLLMAAQLALQLEAGPQRSAVAPRVRNVTASGGAYEAGAQTRRTATWRAPTSTANSGVLGNLVTLRDRSRQATRNDGYAKAIIDELVNNIIGTGITPLSQAPDPTFRSAVQTLWRRWTDESDPEGLLDWYGQTAQAVRCWMEAGDTFVRRRNRFVTDGLSVPMQTQVLEPELCPHTYNVPLLPNGNRVRAGIEFNPIGQRVAYYFHPQRPGDWQDFDPSVLRRIPADAISPMYDPLRAGQLRGLPLLTQTLIRLRELDKGDDATLMRWQLANMFAGFIKRPASTIDPQVDPLTGGSVETAPDGQQMLSLEPGIFQELNPGEEVQFSQPPDVGQTYDMFMRQQLRGACVAAGVPYEIVTGDLGSLNDRVMRVVLQKFRRRIQAWQHQIVVFQLCRPTFNAWLDRAILSGALAEPKGYYDDPAPWQAVKWQPQGWPYLHPVQDIEASRAAIRAGLTTRTCEVGAQGEDAEAIDLEQQADNQRADKLGLKYDSDGRFALNAKASGVPAVPDQAGNEGASA